MITTIVVFDRPVESVELEQLDRPEVLVVLTPAAFAAGQFDGDLPDGREREYGLLVHAAGELNGRKAAVALAADILAVDEGATIKTADCADPDVLGGMLERIGRRAVPLMLDRDVLSAEDLVRTGLADVLIERDRDTVEWLDQWVGERSITAIFLAARLMRYGSDLAERASFSQLFEGSDVKEGLRAFLEKRKPGFNDDVTMERR